VSADPDSCRAGETAFENERLPTNSLPQRLQFLSSKERSRGCARARSSRMCDLPLSRRYWCQQLAANADITQRPAPGALKAQAFPSRTPPPRGPSRKFSRLLVARPENSPRCWSAAEVSVSRCGVDHDRPDRDGPGSRSRRHLSCYRKSRVRLPLGAQPLEGPGGASGSPTRDRPSRSPFTGRCLTPGFRRRAARVLRLTASRGIVSLFPRRWPEPGSTTPRRLVASSRAARRAVASEHADGLTDAAERAPLLMFTADGGLASVNDDGSRGSTSCRQTCDGSTPGATAACHRRHGTRAERSRSPRDRVARARVRARTGAGSSVRLLHAQQRTPAPEIPAFVIEPAKASEVAPITRPEAQSRLTRATRHAGRSSPCEAARQAQRTTIHGVVSEMNPTRQ